MVRETSCWRSSDCSSERGWRGIRGIESGATSTTRTPGGLGAPPQRPQPALGSYGNARTPGCYAPRTDQAGRHDRPVRAAGIELVWNEAETRSPSEGLGLSNANVAGRRPTSPAPTGCAHDRRRSNAATLAAASALLRAERLDATSTSCRKRPRAEGRVAGLFLSLPPIAPSDRHSGPSAGRVRRARQQHEHRVARPAAADQTTATKPLGIRLSSDAQPGASAGNASSPNLAPRSGSLHPSATPHRPGPPRTRLSARSQRRARTTRRPQGDRRTRRGRQTPSHRPGSAAPGALVADAHVSHWGVTKLPPRPGENTPSPCFARPALSPPFRSLGWTKWRNGAFAKLSEANPTTMRPYRRRRRARTQVPPALS